MFKSLLTLMLVVWLMAPAFATSTLVLDLDNPIDVQLLPSAQYYSDPDELLDFNSTQTLDPTRWTPFNREQFRFGFTSGFTWVKTTFRTIGSKNLNIALKLHQSLDSQMLQLRTQGGKAKLFTFGLGTVPNLNESGSASTTSQRKSDHVVINILPNKTYELILRSSSANPVVSDFRALNHETLIAEGQILDSWLYTYLLLTLLIIIYSGAIFLVTRDIANFYQISCVLSVALLLLADYGYISTWFELYDLQLLQKLILLSLTVALLSVVWLFRVMLSNFDSHPPITKYVSNFIIIAGLIIALLVFATSYELAIRLFVINTAMTVLMVCYLILKTSGKDLIKVFFEDYRSMILHLTLLIFAPLTTVHLLTRMGVIKVFWLTDYVLFLGVFIEVFLIAGMLLLNLNHSKRVFRQEELTNSFSLLPNDLALEQQLVASKYTAPQTLLQVWISGFDSLQTTLGSESFREFLVSFAQEAKQRLNGSTLLVRSEAGEGHSLFHSDLSTFVLVCRSLSEEDQSAIVEIIKTSINKAIDPYHEHFAFKVSVGANIFESEHFDFEKVVQRSILALSDGINNETPFNYYTKQIGSNEARQNRLIHDFYNSLKHGEFFLLWQPQFDTHKDIISGVEVLARWKHEEYGMVGPDEFIPLLEQSHRISDLTKWVINTVFDELTLLHESAGKVEVSINLSTRDLSNNDLVDLLDEKLVSHSDLVPYVTMEITESMMIDDYQVVLANVNKLQQRGFKISIDDFGSGYASFAYLQSLPADELKIDKCYTDRFEEPRTSAILESVIELAKSLNMIIVVEGIESTQQIELFTNLGVDRLQGWALGKPMSLDDLILKASTQS